MENFFSYFGKLKKARNIVIILIIGVIIFVVVSIYRAQTATPTSGLAKVPGVSNVPGATEVTPSAQKLSPQYLQALLSSQQAQTQQAIQEGKSSVPLIIQDAAGQGAQGQNLSVTTNIPSSSQTDNAAMTPCVQQCQTCCARGISATTLLNQMIQQGAISPSVADELHHLQDNNASLAEYADTLNRLVKQGGLTPEQARQLLEAYRQQQQLKPATLSSAVPASDLANRLSSSGDISTDTAAALRKAMSGNLSVDDFQKLLDQLVKDGKLTPEQAKQLLAAYRKQHEIGLTGTAGSVSPASDLVNRLLNSGDISADTAAALRKAMSENPSVNDFKKQLDQLVKDGKLTPEQAKQLLAAYRKQHEIGLTGTAGVGTVPGGELIDSLAAIGSISSDVASELKNVLAGNPSIDDYAAKLNQLAQSGQLDPTLAKQLLEAYQKQLGQLPSIISRGNAIDQLLSAGKIDPLSAADLKTLSAQNVPASKYAQKLYDLAKAGKITPQDAQNLLAAYRAEHGDTNVANVPNKNMADLLKSQQQTDLENLSQALNQLQQAQVAAVAETQTQDTQAFQAAISAQTQQLLGAWNVVSQQQMVKGPSSKGAPSGGETATAQEGGQPGSLLESVGMAGKAMPLIKTGDILFAVLNTTVDTDEPGPIMATIVSGKFKGAKLTGSMQRSENNTRVILKFNAMTMEDWPDMININAVAINPDTAKYGLATEVNHHYVQRYGLLFASNFLSGYSDAISNAGDTVLGQLSPTLQTHPELSFGDRAMVALGKVGSSLSDYAGDQFNKPITVRVAAGAGIGILFINSVNVTK